MRRMAACLLAALMVGYVFPEEVPPSAGTEGQGMDIVIVMEASALNVLSDGVGNAPWFGSSCLNDAHFYLAPAETERVHMTYPPAAAVDGVKEGQLSVYDAALEREVLLDTGMEYRFSKSFLTDDEARGFESWKYHFTRNGAGAPLRIDVSEEQGCFGRDDAIRKMAAALAKEAVGSSKGNRAAVIPYGAAGDSRFMTPLTGELDTLLAAIDSAPSEGGGDAAAGLAAALRLLNRRPLLERYGRKAAVLLITGGDVFPPAVWERCASLTALLKAPRGEVREAPFGVFLPERLSVGADAVVCAVGVMAKEGGFFALLERTGVEVFFLPEKEKAEAAASALTEMLICGERVMRELPA